MKKITKTVAAELPPGVLASDLKYPKSYGDVAHDLGDYGVLTFHQVDSRRSTFWCIATLLIGKGKGATSDRTYAVTMSGGVVVVGKGPHVKQTVRVWVRKSRLKALQKYVDLHKKGMDDASQIRFRVSSRRAQGQLERLSGNNSWRWDV